MLEQQGTCWGQGIIDAQPKEGRRRGRAMREEKGMGHEEGWKSRTRVAQLCILLHPHSDPHIFSCILSKSNQEYRSSSLTGKAIHVVIL
jgi:hypothetical protein